MDKCEVHYIYSTLVVTNLMEIRLISISNRHDLMVFCEEQTTICLSSMTT
jgi:hypothetical protein